MHSNLRQCTAILSSLIIRKYIPRARAVVLTVLNSILPWWCWENVLKLSSWSQSCRWGEDGDTQRAIMVVRGTNGQRDLPVKVFVAHAPLSRERERCHLDLPASSATLWANPVKCLICIYEDYLVRVKRYKMWKLINTCVLYKPKVQHQNFIFNMK